MDEDPFKVETNLAASDYWKNILSPVVIEPTFEDTKLYINLNGHEGKLCGLYIVYHQQELCYLCSQKILDSNDKNQRTSHIKAMERFLREDGKGKDFQGKKPNYVIGFYYDNAKYKYNSCANILYSKSRHANESDEKKIKEKFADFIERKAKENNDVTNSANAPPLTKYEFRNKKSVIVTKGFGPRTGGDTGLPPTELYYCSRKRDAKCRCKGCDDICGPYGGCPCNACLYLVKILLKS